ncbi:hypothetical protein VZ95_01030 [Elstera litoralis]|uniref:Transcription factor n=1 Tax=Elstera litoralis TaxID=552518 RepID=A0A0F3IWX9_9PROT|nr:type II toxin-antitoxin system VapB family antitoxin [Elstera litoralis]KJV11048.1 hypothetical protein VZ95_01030 [Elstera litoralis]
MEIAVDAETARAVRRLAILRKETLEQAISGAIREALARTEPTVPDRPLTAAQQATIAQILAQVKALPPLDGAGDDPTAFLYDQNGLPH